jgi:competence protein ComEC
VVVIVYWKKASVKQAAGILAFSLALIMLLPINNPYQHPRLTQLNVGQGSCYLMEAEKGVGVLVDCGGSSNQVGSYKIVPTLKAHGVKRLSHIFLTHLDLDHRVALEDILARFSVGAVVTNPVGKGPQSQSAFAEVQAILRRYRVLHQVMHRGQSMKLKGLEITCLHPEVDFDAKENERSLVLWVKGPKKTVLFTGDLDEVGSQNILLSQCLKEADYLTAPHHGSRNAMAPLLLKVVKPQVILLSSRENFPQEPEVLNFKELKKSWLGDVELEF